MPVKWFDSLIEKKVAKTKKAYLLANGEALVNQMSDLTHVVGGLLKNSVHYKLYDSVWGSGSGKGRFGDFKGNGEGRNQPFHHEQMSAPAINHIKAGSNIIYAGPQNRLNGWADRAVDLYKADDVAVKLGKAVFRKFFK